MAEYNEISELLDLFNPDNIKDAARVFRLTEELSIPIDKIALASLEIPSYQVFHVKDYLAPKYAEQVYHVTLTDLQRTELNKMKASGESETNVDKRRIYYLSENLSKIDDGQNAVNDEDKLMTNTCNYVDNLANNTGNLTDLYNSMDTFLFTGDVTSDVRWSENKIAA